MAYQNMTQPIGSKYSQGKKINITAGAKIFEGSAVFINSSGKGVYTPASGLTYLGVAAHNAENGEKLDVVPEGAFEFTSSSLTGSDLGKTVYINMTENPNTVTVTKPTGQGVIVAPVGKIVKVINGTSCLVRITGFACHDNVE